IDDLDQLPIRIEIRPLDRPVRVDGFIIPAEHIYHIRYRFTRVTAIAIQFDLSLISAPNAVILQNAIGVPDWASGGSCERGELAIPQISLNAGAAIRIRRSANHLVADVCLAVARGIAQGIGALKQTPRRIVAI